MIKIDKYLTNISKFGFIAQDSTTKYQSLLDNCNVHFSCDVLFEFQNGKLVIIISIYNRISNRQQK